MKINIDSGNGLVPSGNKPLPEPLLTQIYVTVCRHKTHNGFTDQLEYIFDSLPSRKCDCNFKSPIFKHILVVHIVNIFYKVSHRQVLLKFTDDKSALGQVIMVWF